MKPAAFTALMLSWVSTRRTPCTALAALISRSTMRPLPIVATASAACRSVGRASSAPKMGLPRTLSKASTRGVAGNGMSLMALSPLFGDHQGVGDRARAQIDSEGIVMTRLRAAERGTAGLAGCLLGEYLAGKRLLGDRHAPGSSGKAADGDARG